MNGYSFKCSNPFYVFLKKHYCPHCGNELLREKITETVNAKSPLAKRHNFEVADITVKGNMNFVHIEFYCNKCKRYYTVKEAKKNKF